MNNSDVIRFGENGFWFKDSFIGLGDRSVLLMRGSAEGAPSHVYTDVREALCCPELAGATLDDPVSLYIAPGVYWTDDPGASDTVRKKDGYSVPFGVYVFCEALNIIGLSEDPFDTVIAGNRGQSHAAVGNYTMLYIKSERLCVKNITVGNYCCVDLVYPADPRLNYPRRTEAVTQAQIAIQEGDSLYASNCRFVGRLNLCPICGAKRAFYERCHFESTDDSLNGSAVYYDCDFDFYGGRPIYETYGTGAVFIGCLFRSMQRGDGASQYITKEGGPVALIDCRIECGKNVSFGWTKYPSPSLKCYQYGLSRNKEPYTAGGEGAHETVMLEGKPALEAYVFSSGGRLFPNILNLLGKHGGWDNMWISEDTENPAKTGIPTLLEIKADKASATAGNDSAEISAECRLFSGELCDEDVSFSVRRGDEEYIELLPGKNGKCSVRGIGSIAEPQDIVVNAHTKGGLEASLSLTVLPSEICAPTMTGEPRIVKSGKCAMLIYELSPSERRDISDISWYRCDSSEDGGVLCGISQPQSPLKKYRFSEADIGKYIRAVIKPTVIGSMPGREIAVIMPERVSESDADTDCIFTDFSDIPLVNYGTPVRGIWIADCVKPVDIVPDSENFGGWFAYGDVPAWKYGKTGNGSVGAGLYQNVQGARLRYTPAHRHGEDMSVTVSLDPAKTAGQGFGSAGQYLDIGIKTDADGLNGYALRIIRVKEYSDAVAMALVEYENGISRLLTGFCATSCFVTGCTLRVSLRGKNLSAHAFSDMKQPAYKSGKYAKEVHLEAQVSGSPSDGVMIWHTGTTGSGGWQNTVMLHSLKAEYDVSGGE